METSSWYLGLLSLFLTLPLIWKLKFVPQLPPQRKQPHILKFDKLLPLNRSRNLNISKKECLDIYENKEAPLMYEKKKNGTNLKYILYYNRVFYGQNRLLGMSRFANCPVKNCYITTSKKLLDSITSWDALVFVSSVLGNACC